MNKKTANRIEQEVNAIRLEIYEKTQGMTPAELTEYYRKSGEASAKKYGFTLVACAWDKRKTEPGPLSSVAEPIQKQVIAHKQ